MREILFRGKRLTDGKWIYGSLMSVHPTAIFVHGDTSYAVEESTVGQYTGTVDKNGKCIFEGDILNQGGEYFGVVMWHPDSYFCINDRKHIDQLTADDSFSAIGYMLRRHAFEVHGNIYDEQDYIDNVLSH